MPQSRGKTDVLTNVRRTDALDDKKDRTSMFYDASGVKLENRRQDTRLREAVENLHIKEMKTVNDMGVEKRSMKKEVEGYKMQKEVAKRATAEAALSSRPKSSYATQHANKNTLSVGARLLSTSSFKTSISSDSSEDDQWKRYNSGVGNKGTTRRKIRVRPKRTPFFSRGEPRRARPKSTSDVNYKDLPTPEELQAIVEGRAGLRRAKLNVSDSSDSESAERELVSHKSMYLKGRSRRQLKELTHIDVISASEEQNKRYQVWAKLMRKKAEQKAEEDKRLQEKVDTFVRKLIEDKERQIREEELREKERLRRLLYPPFYFLNSSRPKQYGPKTFDFRY
ncbi:uncharacterized protein [Ptychodera flava]|uniref:uncharacterized protein n=1 Tax=Ptychodera flava TaxID=63121 RepID=UPI00396A1EFC